MPTETPSSLFCSQAAVLCMRQCLTSNEGLKQHLDTLNSRSTSPHALYQALKPFCSDTHELPCNRVQYDDDW